MPQKEKKRLYFILNKKYLSDNFFRDSKNIFTLNKFILTDEESRSINHYYPNPHKTATKASTLFRKDNSIAYTTKKGITSTVWGTE